MSRNIPHIECESLQQEIPNAAQRPLGAWDLPHMLKVFGVLPPRLKQTPSNRQWNGVLEVTFTIREGVRLWDVK